MYEATRMLPLYRVNADRETGEWLCTPELIGEVLAVEWYEKRDTSKMHFDTYEAPISADGTETETRAIKVVWI